MAPTTPTDRLLTKQIGWTPKKVSNTDEFRPPRRFYLMRSAFVTTRKPGKKHDSINRQENRCNRQEDPGLVGIFVSVYWLRGVGSSVWVAMESTLRNKCGRYSVA